MASLTNTPGSAPALPLNLIAQAIRKLSRHDLEDLTERLIDRLDEIDGDPDLEPEQDRCEASGDGCGPLITDGEVRWGSEWDSDVGLVADYGIDQTREPLGGGASDASRAAGLAIPQRPGLTAGAFPCRADAARLPHQPCALEQLFRCAMVARHLPPSLSDAGECRQREGRRLGSTRRYRSCAHSRMRAHLHGGREGAD